MPDLRLVETPITFHSEAPGFRIDNEEEHAAWLAKIAAAHNAHLAELSIVFLTDDQLLEMNRQYLNHDYYTDILTFDNAIEGDAGIRGDLFISHERVQENAEAEETPMEDELRRVMAHGLLHLLGFNDKSPTERDTMRKAEDAAMALY